MLRLHLRGDYDTERDFSDVYAHTFCSTYNSCSLPNRLVHQRPQVISWTRNPISKIAEVYMNMADGGILKI